MKIFEITEADIVTAKVKKGPLKGFIFDKTDKGYKITAPDGTSMSASNEAEAKRKAEKYARTSKPDTSKKQIKPTKNAPTTTNTDIVAKRDADVKNLKNPPGKDLKPYPLSTPTQDELTKGERRKLARTGKIQRSGQTYTRKQIDAATKDLGGKKSRLAKLGKDLKGVRSTGDAQKVAKHYWDTTENTRKMLSRWFGNRLARQFVTFLNIAALEDALDAYLRVVVEEIDKGKTVEERNKIRDGIIKNKNKPVISAQLDVIEIFSKTIVQAIAIMIAGGYGIKVTLAWLATIGLTTGFVGWLAAVIAGGAMIWGGSELLMKIFDGIGLQDMIERQLMPYLTPERLNNWGNIADTIQDVVATVAGGAVATVVDLPVAAVTGLTGNPVSPGLGKATYDMISDDLVYEEDTKSKEKQVVQSLYKQYPELVQNFKKGKAQGQKMARATLKAN